MSEPVPWFRPLHNYSAGVTPDGVDAKRRDTGKGSRGYVSVSKRGFWGWFVQVFGEALLIGGVTLLLFVAWQIWWTTFMVTPGIESRVAEFENTYPANEQVTEERRTDAPPVIPEASYGEVFGVLHVPKWGMAIPIAEGTSQEILDAGDAGHYEATQMPGELGNFGLAAHRRSYGNSFRGVHIMDPGDPVVVETDVAWLVYEITDHEIVLPNQKDVLLPVPNDPGALPAKRIMSMTTCDPEWGSSHRYILRSELAYWVPKDSGTPLVLAGTR